VAYHAAKEGAGKLLYLMAVISTALAFINILPIPVLDGGHILFIGIEKIRGKPLSEKVRSISQIVGLCLLLLLMVYATHNDILRLLG
jgi:regulator of sigma E protease